MKYKIVYAIVIIILCSTNIVSIVTINEYEGIVGRYVEIVKTYENVTDNYSATVDTAISIIETMLGPKFKADECYKIDLYLDKGWELFLTDSLCTKLVDVRIKYDGTIIEYTAKEFLERLGFDND